MGILPKINKGLRGKLRETVLQTSYLNRTDQKF